VQLYGAAMQGEAPAQRAVGSRALEPRYNGPESTVPTATVVGSYTVLGAPTISFSADAVRFHNGRISSSVCSDGDYVFR
jgi:hypothetical protein